MMNGQGLEIVTGILDNFPAFVCVTHKADGKIVYCNDIFKQTFGIHMENGDINSLFHGQSGIRFIDVKQTQSLLEYDTQLDVRWFRVSEYEATWLDGVLSKIVVGTDFCGLLETEEQMLVELTTDSMTGIYNKKYGLSFLQKQIQSVKDNASWFSVCYLDINDLKFVNDTYGHQEGDLYIMTVVDVAKQSVRASDGFARMGGDEFMIVLPNCRRNIADTIMETVNKKLKWLCDSENREFTYSVSYGIKEVTMESKLCVDLILQEVDSKMYYMKEEYRNTKRLKKALQAQ